MGFLHHIRSALHGAGTIGWAVMATGLIGMGVAMAGAPAFIGLAGTVALTGGCTWLASVGASALLGGGIRQHEPVKRLAFVAGVAAAAYCMYNVAGPGHEANAGKFAQHAKTLTGQFEHAAKKVARDVNSHIIWPDLKPAGDRHPAP